MWNRPVHGEKLLSVTDQEAAKRAKKVQKLRLNLRKMTGDQHHHECLDKFETKYSAFSDNPTDVEEVS